MGTMWYHENFKKLFRAKGSYSPTSGSNYLPLISLSGSVYTFTNIAGTNAATITLNGAIGSVSSTSSLYANAALANLLRFKCKGRTDSADFNVVSNTRKVITIGNYSGSWDGLNDAPENRISNDLYRISCDGLLGVNQPTDNNASVITPTITITNISQSSMSMNYAAYILPDYNVKGYLMWAYIFDEPINLAPDTSITLGFSPWGTTP